QQRGNRQNHKISMIKEHLRADQVTGVEQQSRADPPERTCDENSEKGGTRSAQANQRQLGATRQLAKEFIVQRGVDDVQVDFGSGHQLWKRRTLEIVENRGGWTNQNQFASEKLAV